jgi:hypothetical protein
MAGSAANMVVSPPTAIPAVVVLPHFAHDSGHIVWKRASEQSSVPSAESSFMNAHPSLSSHGLAVVIALLTVLVDMVVVCVAAVVVLGTVPQLSQVTGHSFDIARSVQSKSCPIRMAKNVHAVPSMQPPIVAEVVVALSVVGTTAAVVVKAMVASESHNPQVLGHDAASLTRIGLVQSTGESANTLHTVASTFTGHGPNPTAVAVATVPVAVDTELVPHCPQAHGQRARQMCPIVASLQLLVFPPVEHAGESDSGHEYLVVDVIVKVVDVIVEVSVELASSAIVPLQLLHATGQSALIVSRRPLFVSEQSDTSVHKMGLSSLPSQTDAAAEGRAVAKRIATANAGQDHHLEQDPALCNLVVELFLILEGGRAAPFPHQTRGDMPGENPLLAGVDIPIAESVWQVRQLPTYSALPHRHTPLKLCATSRALLFNQTVDTDD